MTDTQIAGAAPPLESETTRLSARIPAGLYRRLREAFEAEKEHTHHGGHTAASGYRTDGSTYVTISTWSEWLEDRLDRMLDEDDEG